MKPEAVKLVESNVALAISIANRVHRRCPSMELEELCDEARLQLCIAAEAFDPARGAAFSTYAFHCIESKLLTFCRRNMTDPSHASEVLHELGDAAEGLPNPEEGVTYDYEAILDIESACEGTSSRAAIRRRIKGGKNA